jgi:hypothetical protein
VENSSELIYILKQQQQQQKTGAKWSQIDQKEARETQIFMYEPYLNPTTNISTN